MVFYLLPLRCIRFRHRPDFQLGDDKSDTNGNYFYVQTYNGEKRANSQSPSNNWEVIPQTIINTSQPIFKKNKGYLIAIDASADRQNLRFSSKAGDIPIDFGKNGQASIPVSINNQSQNQNHNGWYLCGNPLPAPLSLSQIESNSALDGYIYIYDGSTYQPYVIGSDFAILHSPLSLSKRIKVPAYLYIIHPNQPIINYYQRTHPYLSRHRNLKPDKIPLFPIKYFHFRN